MLEPSNWLIVVIQKIQALRKISIRYRWTPWIGLKNGWRIQLKQTKITTWIQEINSHQFVPLAIPRRGRWEWLLLAWLRDYKVMYVLCLK